MAFWLLLGVQTSSAQVPGTSDKEAKGWFVNGQHLYNDGRYRDALVAFEAAYRMSGRPNILRSIAYCHENLGELERALNVLYRYRGLAEEDKIAEIEQHIRRLEESLQPAEPIPIVAEPIPAAPEPEPVAAEPSPRRIEPKRAWKLSTGPAVGYGIAGVALVTGGVFGLQALSARSEAEKLCSTGDAGFCPREAARYLNNDASYSLSADISFGVAGAAALGATVWMFVENSQKSSVQIVPFGNGVRLQGRF